MTDAKPTSARGYDAIKIGEAAELTRTVTANDLVFYSHASGDLNPLHLPELDGDGDGVAEAFAPTAWLAGLLSALVGNKLPGPGSRATDFSGQAGEPLRLGETARARIEVTGKTDGRLYLKGEVSGPSGPALTAELTVLPPGRPRDFDAYDLPALMVRRHPHFDRLLRACDGVEPARTAVVFPHSEDALGGALQAAKRGLITPILIGRPADIKAAARTLDADLSSCEIVEAHNGEDAAAKACGKVADGEADSVMKGHLHTDAFLRAVLNRSHGLRGRRRISHAFVLDVPGRDGLLFVTDAAVNIAPDLAAKADIVQNAIDLACSLGIEQPRAAVLSAVETVNAALPSTLDAAALSKMADRRQIARGLVDGPLAMDNAVDRQAAKLKKLTGEVAGRADILVAPDLEAGNMLAKELTYLARAETAGIVLGAKAPVILTSRADGAFSRLVSCAVAALHAAWLKAGEPAAGLREG
ncbi:MAG: bifunctional enoyl-CoA hydratase/phosphate acetyltransferase [Oceanicaulis sp.]